MIPHGTAPSHAHVLILEVHISVGEASSIHHPYEEIGRGECKGRRQIGRSVKGVGTEDCGTLSIYSLLIVYNANLTAPFTHMRY